MEAICFHLDLPLSCSPSLHSNLPRLCLIRHGATEGHLPSGILHFHLHRLPIYRKIESAVLALEKKGGREGEKKACVCM